MYNLSIIYYDSMFAFSVQEKVLLDGAFSNTCFIYVALYETSFYRILLFFETRSIIQSTLY